jgi:hypothetical protein
MPVREIFDFNQADYEDANAPKDSFGKLIDEGGACYGISMYWMSWFASAWGQGVGFKKLLANDKYEQALAAKYMVKYQNVLLDDLLAKRAYPVNSGLAQPDANAPDGREYAPVSNTSIFGRLNNHRAYQERQKALDAWGASVEPALKLHKSQVIKFVHCNLQGVPDENPQAMMRELVADLLALHRKEQGKKVIGMLSIDYWDQQEDKLAGHAVAFAYKEPLKLTYFDPNAGQFEITGTDRDIAAEVYTLLAQSYAPLVQWWWAPMIPQ